MSAHGDPATDPPMTVRVHPDDDPHNPAARRAMRVHGRVEAWPWVNVTGEDAGYLIDHDDVAGWPVTHPIVWGAAFRHALHAGHGQRAAEPASLTPDESSRLFRMTP